MTRYTTEGLAGTASELTTLESERRSDLATFLGTALRANQRDGAGINRARRIAANLAASPPDNLCSQAVCEKWRNLLNRANQITAG